MSAAAVEPSMLPSTKRAIHLTLQGKGGVGKSFVSVLLAQYLRGRHANIRCVDTDPVNHTFSSYGALEASRVDILNGARIDERRFDGLMDRLLMEDEVFVVDNGATSFIPLTNYLVENGALGMLRESGREVLIHCVITGNQGLADTLAGFKALAEQTPDRNIVVWLNGFLGPIERDGKGFTEMRVYTEHKSKVRGIVEIVARNPDTYGKDIADMTSRALTFDEVLQDGAFSLMSKQRMQTVRRDIFEQLAGIGL